MEIAICRLTWPDDDRTGTMRGIALIFDDNLNLIVQRKFKFV